MKLPRFLAVFLFVLSICFAEDQASSDHAPSAVEEKSDSSKQLVPYVILTNAYWEMDSYVGIARVVVAYLNTNQTTEAKQLHGELIEQLQEEFTDQPDESGMGKDDRVWLRGNKSIRNIYLHEVIQTYVDHGMFEYALDIEPVLPAFSQTILEYVVAGYLAKGNMSAAQSVLERIPENLIEYTRSVYAVALYQARSGEMDSAFSTMSRIKSRNLMDATEWIELLFKAGEEKEARQWVLDTLARLQEASVPYPEIGMRLLKDISVICAKFEQSDLMEQTLKRAESWVEKHPSAVNQAMMAVIYHLNRHTDQGQLWFNKALQAARDEDGSDSDLVTAWVAGLMVEAGEYSQALRLVERYYDERLSEDTGAFLLVRTLVVATSFAKQGKTEQMDQLIQEGIRQIEEKVVDDFSRAMLMGGMATFYAQENLLDRATDVLRKLPADFSVFEYLGVIPRLGEQSLVEEVFKDTQQISNQQYRAILLACLAVRSHEMNQSPNQTYLKELEEVLLTLPEDS